MLTHLIKLALPKKEPERKPTALQQQSPWFNNLVRTPVRKMGKLEYAQYVNTLPYKKGDLLVHRTVIDKWGGEGFLPIKDASSVLMVVDIQEVHHLVDYDTYQGKPRALFLRTCRPGGSTFWSEAYQWAVVNPDKLEKTVRDIVVAERDYRVKSYH